MPTLKDLIQSIADKAGVSATEQNLINLLGNTALAGIEIPEALQSVFDKSLISIDNAKNDHPTIKQHYFARAYNGLDKTIGETMDELQVPDDIRKKVNAQTSSTQKAATLSRELEKYYREQKKSGDSTPAELETLRNQVNTFNDKLAKKEDQITKLKEAHAAEIKGIKRDSAVTSRVSKYKTKYDDGPAVAKNAAIRALIDEALSTQDGVIDIDDHGEPILKKKDGTNFYNEKQELITFDKFLDLAFSKSGVLLQNNSGGNSRDGRSGNNSQNRRDQHSAGGSSQNDNNGNNGPNINSRVSEMIGETLNSLQSNSHPSML